jgi:hypothetical protein
VSEAVADCTTQVILSFSMRRRGTVAGQSSTASRAIVGAGPPGENTPISFPTWNNALAQTGLPSAVRGSHEGEIWSFRRFCQVAHAPATVALAGTMSRFSVTAPRPRGKRCAGSCGPVGSRPCPPSRSSRSARCRPFGRKSWHGPLPDPARPRSLTPCALTAGFWADSEPSAPPWNRCSDPHCRSTNGANRP